MTERPGDGVVNRIVAALGVVVLTVVIVVALGPAGSLAADTIVASDTFGRTVTSGWGNADVGGAWTASGGAGAFSVGSGAGSIRLGAAGASRAAYLAGPQVADTGMFARLRLDRSAAGGSQYAYLVGRRGGNARDRLREHRRVQRAAAHRAGVPRASSRRPLAVARGDLRRAGAENDREGDRGAHHVMESSKPRAVVSGRRRHARPAPRRRSPRTAGT